MNFSMIFINNFTDLMPIFAAKIFLDNLPTTRILIQEKNIFQMIIGSDMFYLHYFTWMALLADDAYVLHDEWSVDIVELVVFIGLPFLVFAVIVGFLLEGREFVDGEISIMVLSVKLDLVTVLPHFPDGSVDVIAFE